MTQASFEVREQLGDQALEFIIVHSALSKFINRRQPNMKHTNVHHIDKSGPSLLLVYKLEYTVYFKCANGERFDHHLRLVFANLPRTECKR